MSETVALADGDEFLKLIPQKMPFVMAGCLYSCDEKSIRTGFTPSEKNIFADNGCFTEPGLIENMAQSAAAGTGYYYLSQNKPVPVGFIGAIKDFKLLEFPKINTPLVTEIDIVAEVMNATVIKAKVNCNGKEIAHCEMKIFLLETKP